MRWLAVAFALVGCREPARDTDRELEPPPLVRPDASRPPSPPASSDVEPTPALPRRALSLEYGRQECAAVALRDASVLVIGGYDHHKPGPGEGLASTERLDLVTGTIRAAAPMTRSRYRHTATLLLDGRILVVGGVASHGGPAIELYEPARDRWRALAAPESWLGPRWGHTATLLADGRVLVVGGILSAQGRTAEHADVFDPRTERWTVAASLVRARDEHTATRLRDGRVLVAGGRAFAPPLGAGITTLDHAEIYDPARDRWDAVAPMKSARSDHASAILPDGRVLVTGGVTEVAIAGVEIFDPERASWTTTGSLRAARFHHTATALEAGIVVAGGWQRDRNLDTTEIFDHASGAWRSGPKLGIARDHHCAVGLATGILLFGGQSTQHFSLRPIEVLALDAFAPP